METWLCAGWVLNSNGDMGVCWVGVVQQWKHECVLGGVEQLWKHGCAWVGAEQQWGHGCLLGGCWAAMEKWVCAGWVLNSNGGMGVCWVGAEQQWRHECVLGGC